MGRVFTVDLKNISMFQLRHILDKLVAFVLQYYVILNVDKAFIYTLYMNVQAMYTLDQGK